MDWWALNSNEDHKCSAEEEKGNSIKGPVTLFLFFWWRGVSERRCWLMVVVCLLVVGWLTGVLHVAGLSSQLLYQLRVRIPHLLRKLLPSGEHLKG